MSTSEFTRDLRQAAAVLGDVAAEGELPEIAGALSSLTEICTRFGNAWSGSWFGYHSRVYYRNFQPPPAGARFSSEWGFMNVPVTETRGDWVEYQCDEVINAIEASGGNTDLGPAEEYAKRAGRALEEGRAIVVSVLTAALPIREDMLVRESLDEDKAMKLLSQRDVATINMPFGAQKSRDTTALSQDYIAPPHLGYLGHLVESGDPGRRCGELGNQARRMADHLDRTLSSARPLRSFLKERLLSSSAPRRGARFLQLA